ncbi:unnamed protein product [Ambrosiozyma monospora]|uniref:Unnamed protein product n=1 Tax=Ambrosiozyma monospora TaxID=43982 RepID=A0ACB5U7Q2_AMBMO|nr:unnamed protein product [Ambrosiozyma monospora]
MYQLKDLYFRLIHENKKCVTPTRELAYLAFSPTSDEVEFEYEGDNEKKEEKIEEEIQIDVPPPSDAMNIDTQATDHDEIYGSIQLDTQDNDVTMDEGYDENSKAANVVTLTPPQKDSTTSSAIPNPLTSEPGNFEDADLIPAFEEKQHDNISHQPIKANTLTSLIEEKSIVDSAVDLTVDDGIDDEADISTPSFTTVANIDSHQHQPPEVSEPTEQHFHTDSPALPSPPPERSTLNTVATTATTNSVPAIAKISPDQIENALEIGRQQDVTEY